MLNSRDIADLRPDVATNCRILLDECKKRGLNVLVTQTKRDNEYQATLYAQGRTKPGSIVTNSATTTFHGAGLAFDVCKNIKGHEYDDVSFFAQVASIAKQIGFTWGGDWKSFPDKPHFQWDNHGKASYKSAPTMPKYIAEEEDMDVSKLTDKECYEIIKKAQAYANKLPADNWAVKELNEAANAGITDGTKPLGLATRQEVAIMCKRAVKKK